ncbi:MAG: glycosyltransferase family 4 protein [Patescibacteria group bacterium]
MKIAILSATFSHFSGIDRVVEQQANQLIQEGNQVTIFALEAEMKPQQANLVVLGMPRGLLAQRMFRLLFPLFLSRVNDMVKKLEGYATVFSHQYPLNHLAHKAKKKFGAKYIYYNHGVASSKCFNSPIEKIYIKKFIWLANRSVKKADQAISISRYLQGVLKEETGIDSQVVYDKVDTNRFHPGIDGGSVRRNYNIGNNPLILYVGRISPHKGVHLLIKSFLEVKKKIDNAKLMIVGKPTFAKYAKQLKEMAAPDVIFTGFVADQELPQYYGACDVYATASLWEGYNLPMAEAQACGKPVIAWDLGPHPEVIDQNGILVKPEHKEGLAQAIIQKIS